MASKPGISKADYERLISMNPADFDGLKSKPGITDTDRDLYDIFIRPHLSGESAKASLANKFIGGIIVSHELDRPRPTWANSLQIMDREMLLGGRAAPGFSAAANPVPSSPSKPPIDSNTAGAKNVSDAKSEPHGQEATPHRNNASPVVTVTVSPDGRTTTNYFGGTFHNLTLD